MPRGARDSSPSFKPLLATRIVGGPSYGATVGDVVDDLPTTMRFGTLGAIFVLLIGGVGTVGASLLAAEAFKEVDRLVSPPPPQPRCAHVASPGLLFVRSDVVLLTTRAFVATARSGSPPPAPPSPPAPPGPVNAPLLPNAPQPHSSTPRALTRQCPRSLARSRHFRGHHLRHQTRRGR